jgi:hypothetical protein
MAHPNHPAPYPVRNGLLAAALLALGLAAGGLASGIVDLDLGAPSVRIDPS